MRCLFIVCALLVFASAVPPEDRVSAEGKWYYHLCFCSQDSGELQWNDLDAEPFPHDEFELLIELGMARMSEKERKLTYDEVKLGNFAFEELFLLKVIQLLHDWQQQVNDVWQPTMNAV